MLVQAERMSESAVPEMQMAALRAMIEAELVAALPMQLDAKLANEAQMMLGEMVDEILAQCYQNSLRQAATKVCKTLAFSAISTGVYGFPKAQAVEIAVREVMAALPLYPFLNQVVFCCFDKEMLDLYDAELAKYAAQPDTDEAPEQDLNPEQDA